MIIPSQPPSLRRRLGARLDRAPRVKAAIKALYYRAKDPFGRGRILPLGGRLVRVPSRFAEQPWTDYEPAATRAVADWLDAHPGATLFDVGSSVGLYSLLALASSPSARAWAFDADDVSLQATRWLVRHHGPDRLHVVHGLVSDQSGSALSAAEAHADTLRHLDSARVPREPSLADYVCIDGTSRPALPVYTLDSLFPVPAKLAPLVIKIDVEGAELHVLRGAAGLIQALRPALLVSVHPDSLLNHGHHRDDVEAWLRQFNYSPRIHVMPHEEHWWCAPPAA